MPDFNAFYESFFSDRRQEEEAMDWEDVPFLPEVSAPFVPSRPPRKMRSLISVQVSEPLSLSSNRFPTMRALVPKLATALASMRVRKLDDWLQALDSLVRSLFCDDFVDGLGDFVADLALDFQDGTSPGSLQEIKCDHGSQTAPARSAYTRQKARSKYRNRISLERVSQEQSNVVSNKTPFGRVIQCRERKKMNATERISNGDSISTAGAIEIMQVDDEISSILTQDCVGIDFVRWSFMRRHWAAASARFTTTFANNPFGHQ
ncbi:uncharacterized protein TNCV_1300151 [Trichonephila clavipes]|nr:uncharacterized protein TNCV_1300151 [Trichonephila clavipes]